MGFSISRLQDERSPVVAMIEAHEDFIQHIEQGARRIKTLSMFTVIVAAVLTLSYAYQLLLPYFTGVTSVSVSLDDPLLQATEVALIALSLLWLYIGLADYVFTRRMAAAIREARAVESELERKVTSQEGASAGGTNL